MGNERSFWFLSYPLSLSLFWRAVRHLLVHRAKEEHIAPFVTLKKERGEQQINTVVITLQRLIYFQVQMKEIHYQ